MTATAAQLSWTARYVLLTVERLQDGDAHRWVGLAELRDAMDKLPERAEQDLYLTEIALAQAADIIPMANLKALTPRDRAAALVIGDTAQNMIRQPLVW